MEKIRLANVIHYTTADGPGLRHSIYTQGCLHGCPGCHNLATHSISGGQEYFITEVLDDIQRNFGVSGITISGGEPLLQYKQVVKLLQGLRSNRQLRRLNLMLYTGYEWKQVLLDFPQVLTYVNSIMTGKFILELKKHDLLFRGSTNQFWVDVDFFNVYGKVREVQDCH